MQQSKRIVVPFLVVLSIVALITDGMNWPASIVVYVCGTMVSIVLSTLADEPWIVRRGLQARLIKAHYVASFGTGALVFGMFLALLKRMVPKVIEILQRKPTASGVVAIVTLGILGFLLRKYLRAFYGLIEIAVSVELAIAFMQDSYDVTKRTIASVPWDDAIKGLLCASVYLFVRGADNLEVGLFDNDEGRRDRLWMWFCRGYASRIAAVKSTS